MKLGKNRNNDTSEPRNHFIIYENHQRLCVFEEKYNLDDLFIFTFVRNPYERVISWFYYHKNTDIYKNISLEEWINQGCKTHFKIQNQTDWIKEKKSPLLQYNFIESSKQKVDFIGKIENFNSDIKKVINILNESFCENKLPKKIKFKDIKLNKSKKEFTVLSQKSKDIIYNLFKKDFEYFGYDK